VRDEREMDRVLAIEGIELIGINNRNLGMAFQHPLIFMLEEADNPHVVGFSFGILFNRPELLCCPGA
jgi:hypothetical protein